MERLAHIYGLFDPRTGQLRYIGKTMQPLNERVNQHLARVSSKTHKNMWLRQLKEQGMRPTCVSITQCTVDVVDQRERELIALFKELGADLTNHTVGGEGGDTWSGRRHSQETRRKMSEIKVGKVFSQETRDRMSQSAKLRIRHPHSEETRAKMREARIRIRKVNNG
jgi:hypothetical protein